MTVSILPVFTVRRAEEAYRQREKERERAEAIAEQRRLAQHARSQQQAQEARRALASPHRSLALALAWFRAEWQASSPWRLHEHDEEWQKGDVLGAPAWTERWKTWLMEVDPDDPTPARDPLRRAHLLLRSSESPFDNAGADYLFRLACLDFDMERAALSMVPPIALPYIPWYAEKAIDRLRERMEAEHHRQAPTVPRPEWMARLGIGKSEAQHRAEEDVA